VTIGLPRRPLAPAHLVHRRGNFLRNLPVGRKLLFAFGSVALLLALVLIGQIAEVRALSRSAQAIGDSALTRVEAAADVDAVSHRVHEEQLAYLLDGGLSRERFEEAARSMTDAVERLGRSSASPVEVRLARKIASGQSTFMQLDAMIWDAARAGNAEKARNLAEGPEAIDLGFVRADIASYSDAARNDAAALSVRIQSQFAAATRRATVIGMSAFGLVIVLCALIQRAILTPLRRVQDAAERAAAGDMSEDVVVDRTDETGRLGLAFNAMQAGLRDREVRLRRDADRQEFDAQLHRALELAEGEAEAVAVARQALGEAAPGLSVELLLSDSSKTHMDRMAVAGPESNGPGCPLTTPWGCPAVRQGQSIIFPSSTALDACPKLKDRPVGVLSAVCVPVSFMGRAIGVLHAAGPDGHPPGTDTIASLQVVATQAGGRVGMIRSMDRTSLQAATDGLTGLLNRRSFETRARAVVLDERPYAVAMADLDHFKRLNDTYGHAGGDRALRLFAKILQTTLRPDDIPARFGGEEFIIVFPRASAREAANALERVRVALAQATGADGSAPSFTSSFGVADGGPGTDLDQVVVAADAALYRAKSEGRDRVVVAADEPVYDLTRATRPDHDGGDPIAARHGGFLRDAAFDDPRDP